MLYPQSLLLLLLIFFAQLTQAETLNESCVPYTIVFGNGVGNSKEDARKSLIILKGLIGSTYKGKDVNYEIAYNPTEGPGAGTILDVIESAKQKAGENNTLWSLTWKVVFGVVAKAEPNQSWVETVAKIWTDFNSKIIAGMRYNLANKSSYYDATAASHVALYKKLLTSPSDPQQVLLVAHSQGNLYGNIAFQKLERDLSSTKEGKKYLSRFAMVGVGSAADYVYMNGPYLTSTYDNVINTVRTMYPTVLLGNIIMPAVAEYKTTNANGEPVAITDHTGHGFATAYTNNAYAGRALLKDHIEHQLSSLDGKDENGYDEEYDWYMARERTSGGVISEEELSGNEEFNHSYNCFDLSKEMEEECATAWNKEFSGFFLTSVREFGEVQLAHGSGKDALEQYVVPRIFDPLDRAYIGFPKSKAKIKYKTIDELPYVWVQWPVTDPGPETYQWILPKRVYLGVKSCKS